MKTEVCYILANYFTVILHNHNKSLFVNTVFSANAAQKISRLYL